MTSFGLVANGNKETILKAISTLRGIPELHIIFVRQSDQRLYIVDESTFNLTKEPLP